MLRLLYFQGTLPVGKYNGMQSVHSFQDSLEEVHQKMMSTIASRSHIQGTCPCLMDMLYKLEVQKAA